MFLNNIDCKSLRKVKWDLKRVSNLIQTINNFGVKNKHDMIKFTHSMLWYLNQNIVDKEIIITLRN